MKLHSSVVDRLVQLFKLHGGHREEWRLKNELSKIDLSVYAQQTTGNSILVQTDEIKNS
jgi:hypothetical protein